MAEPSDEELLAALGVTPELKKTSSRTPREERVTAGFEDILKFFEANGRAPLHGEDRDIFERLYAVRLDRLREQAEWRRLLTPMDVHKLLISPAKPQQSDDDALDDAAILAGLGVETDRPEIATLRHVRPREEVRAAEEVANRTVCKDFEAFRTIFDQVKADLDRGARETRRFGKDAEIKLGEFFILSGQLTYVASVGEEMRTPYGRPDRRLRVIYDNATESDLLLRSLQRALYKDEAGRRVTNPSAGPLFGGDPIEDDLESGTIYVLRSKSDHPKIAAHRELIHKIGVTGGDVDIRIANAALDPTYLLGEVEVMATYKLFNINRSKLENLLHRIFASARLDLLIEDRFGHRVRPREWYLVPLPAIDEVVDRIRDRSIINFEYDPATARLKLIDDTPDTV